jgi:hypothetical protein
METALDMHIYLLDTKKFFKKKDLGFMDVSKNM